MLQLAAGQSGWGDTRERAAYNAAVESARASTLIAPTASNGVGATAVYTHPGDHIEGVSTAALRAGGHQFAAGPDVPPLPPDLDEESYHEPIDLSQRSREWADREALMDAAMHRALMDEERIDPAPAQPDTDKGVRAQLRMMDRMAENLARIARRNNQLERANAIMSRTLQRKRDYVKRVGAARQRYRGQRFAWETRESGRRAKYATLDMRARFRKLNAQIRDYRGMQRDGRLGMGANKYGFKPSRADWGRQRARWGHWGNR